VGGGAAAVRAVGDRGGAAAAAAGWTSIRRAQRRGSPGARPGPSSYCNGPLRRRPPAGAERVGCPLAAADCPLGADTGPIVSPSGAGVEQGVVVRSGRGPACCCRRQTSGRKGLPRRLCPGCCPCRAARQAAAIISDPRRPAPKDRSTRLPAGRPLLATPASPQLRPAVPPSSRGRFWRNGQCHRAGTAGTPPANSDHLRLPHPRPAEVAGDHPSGTEKPPGEVDDFDPRLGRGSSPRFPACAPCPHGPENSAAGRRSPPP
jgi:hypothetical protein